MAGTDPSDQIASAVSRLSLKTGSGSNQGKETKSTKKKAAPVADSWEDEELSSSGSDTETERSSPNRDTGLVGKDIGAGTHAPPPTPISPTYNNAAGGPFHPPTSTPTSASPAPRRSQFDGPPGEAKRPEKTDAVARRMIAAGLGLRIPKQTEEQRAYDKALREKERHRREQEREEEKKKQAAAEKAKQAIWDD